MNSKDDIEKIKKNIEEVNGQAVFTETRGYDGEYLIEYINEQYADLLNTLQKAFDEVNVVERRHILKLAVAKMRSLQVSHTRMMHP